MPDGLVSEYFDLAALNLQKEQAEKIILEYFETAKKVNSNPIDGEGQAKALAELAKQVKILADAKIQLDNAEGKLAISQTELGKRTVALRVETAANNKVAKEEAQLASNLTGAYERLNIQHKQLVKAYQDAAAAGKLSSAELVGMKDKANALGSQLAKIDVDVQKHGRNVGNYSSQWNGLGNAINQISREVPNFAQSFQLGILAISNNLPILQDELKNARLRIAELKAEGKEAPSLFSQIAKSIISWQTALTLGIALALKYSKELEDFGRSLKELIFPVTAAEKAQRAYSAALADTKIGTLIADISRVSEVLKLAEGRFISKEKALKEYNSTLGSTFGYTQDLNTAEKNIVENSKNVIQATALKTVALQAYTEAAKFQVQMMQKMELTTLQNILTLGDKSFKADVLKNNRKFAEEEFARLTKIGDDALAAATKLSANVVVAEEKDNKKRTKAAQDLTSEKLAAKQKEIEEQRLIDIQRLQEEADTAKAISDNTDKSYEDRIHALDTYLKKKESILKLNYQAEIQGTTESLAKIAEIEKKSPGSRTNEENVLLLNKKNLTTHLLALQEKYDTDENKQVLEGEKERLKIVKDFSDKQVKEIESRLNNIQLAGKKAGLSDVEILQNQIAYISEASKAWGLSVESRKKLGEELTNLLIKQQKEIDTEEEKLEKKRDMRRKENLKAAKVLARELAMLVYTLLQAQAENEIAALERSKEISNEKYEADKEAIDKSFQAEEDKDAQKKVLEAEQKERNAEIDKEIKQQKRNQAIYDKLLALAQITINTAVNASKAGSPIAAALYIAAGAVQAGIVAATPIPEYAKGKSKNNPYSGDALAGEAGTEMWVKKDGTLELITKPRIIPTLAGDTILSQKQLAQGAALPYLQKAGVAQDNGDIKDFFRDQFSKQNRILGQRDTLVIDNSKYYERVKSIGR